MLNRLFPPNINNQYQGSWIALWLFIPVLLLKSIMGFNFSGLNPFIDLKDILQSVDGVPMDTYPAAVVTTIVNVSSAWGIALLSLCLFVWLIVLRYRSALPLAILVVLVEQLGRTGLDLIPLISRMIVEGRFPGPGGYLNLGMALALVAAFAFSLALKRKPKP